MGDDTRFVNVFDFKTQTTTTIPAAELAPGMVQITIQGREGIFWANLSDAASGLLPSPFRHPPFDKKIKGKLRKIMGLLKEVHSLSLKEWEDGFRRDQNPEEQIESWLEVASHYEDLNKQFALNHDQKMELFNLLLQCSINPYEHITKVFEPKELTPEITKAVIEVYYGQPELKNQVASLPPCEFPGPDGGIPLPVETLMTPEGRENLKEADIVFGVDAFTGDTPLFYGKEMLERVVREEVTENAGIISYLYDSRTDQLELLVAAMIAVKGSCCFRDGNFGLEDD